MPHTITIFDENTAGNLATTFIPELNTRRLSVDPAKGR